MVKYCIYCGRLHTQENPVVNNVCLECMIKKGKIITLKKNVVKASLCKICGSVKIGFRWVETHGFEEAIDSIVREIVPQLITPAPGVERIEVKGYKLKTVASWRTVVELYINGVYGGRQFSVSTDLIIMLEPTKCPRCTMYDSREFDAVIQIRGYDLKHVSKAIEKIVSKDRKILRDLIDTIETGNGIDLYFYGFGAARKLARKLATQLRASLHESFEVTGTRSGKKRSRLYISLKPSDKSH